jgi:threonine aldolase
MNRLAVQGAPAAAPDDRAIAGNIRNLIRLSSAIDETRISVAVAAGVVILEGTLDSFWKKARVEALTAEVAGVTSIHNKIAVVPSRNILDEVIAGDTNHIMISEQGGMAVIAGVQTRPLDTVNGAMDPAKVEATIRKITDIHFPKTGLIELENSHSCGRVVPLENMKTIREISLHYKVPIHLDGARIFNAATVLGVPASEIASYADSVMFCLSKGLCAPVGSMLTGSKEFIAKARRKAKLMGGGMRQVGVLAAAGILSIEVMTKRLGEDHKNAKRLADGIHDLPGIKLDLSNVETNMVWFDYENAKVENAVFVATMREKGIKISGSRGKTMRFCTHNGISAGDVEATITACREILG